LIVLELRFIIYNLLYLIGSLFYYLLFLIEFSYLFFYSYTINVNYYMNILMNMNIDYTIIEKINVEELPIINDNIIDNEIRFNM
jgi:hypothetical protein